MDEFELEGILEKSLEEMAVQDKKFFSPHFVCTYTGIADLKAVSEYLFTEAAKTKRKKIYVYYEVECPEGDSDFSVDTPEKLPIIERRCHICGIDYIPNPERIWVGFNFTSEYLQFVKKRS
ncbi:hypothetical protein [Paenibacillus sp. EPM92]|uniref:hypothetical protein n=1 Tax=Paenibacillus sp. EPM92 TaxID=1561195 RepID=UPI001916147F|nr:hypothetical protein [Paenibacillus sp. EPM92]